MGRILGGALLAAAFAGAQDLASLDFTGVGWVQYGQFGHLSDTTVNNYRGNSAQNSGAQISMHATIAEDLAAAVGLGMFEGHPMAGQVKGGGRVPISVSPYIAEASFTYRMGDKERPLWQLTGGLFPYNYNPNIKDLGLYLLRGPVYPGIIMSGFETKEVLPIANALGFWLRNHMGIFRQDLLLLSETEIKPFFDVSLAYIMQAGIGDFLHVGGGVNFYRLLPQDERVTRRPFFRSSEQDSANPFLRQTIYVDNSSGVPDTTIIGFDGTKVMANFDLDVKKLLGLGGAFGSEDLILYSEAALIGLNFDKAHKVLYGEVGNRTPVMAGFNFPMFGYLDHFSLEAEWYGAKFKDELTRYTGNNGSRTVSPIPVTTSKSADVPVVSRDNVKWALHAAKTIQGHFKVSGQVANDHFRPGGTMGLTSLEAALTTPSDWYWMAKIAYFF